MPRLRLLSFNIHGGRSRDGKRDLRRVNALLDEYDVDIAVLQEMEMRLSRGARVDDVDLVSGEARPHRLAGPSLTQDDGWYGNLIASRYPIMRSHVHNLETRKELEPRCAVDALIETPYGRLRVIGTHLSLSRWERWSEANNLLKLVDMVEETEKNPLVLMGDLNEWRNRSKLLSHLDRLLIAMPCGPTFPSAYPLLRLDRAWHDAGHLSASATVLKTRPIAALSDHLPVLVEIDLPSGRLAA
jgi:endonuclease/exonuclease/phosphatase family metal-dependent hydrolase